MTQISIVREFSITSMKGGYRRVLQRPIDCEWYVQLKQNSTVSFNQLLCLCFGLLSLTIFAVQ